MFYSYISVGEYIYCSVGFFMKFDVIKYYMYIFFRCIFCECIDMKLIILYYN